jgi:hypothetical protein
MFAQMFIVGLLHPAYEGVPELGANAFGGPYRDRGTIACQSGLNIGNEFQLIESFELQALMPLVLVT